MSAKTSTPDATGTVRSADGTTIAYEARGDGPVVVCVDGALSYRGFGGGSRPLATELAARGFTAVSYDRRGRGESTDTEPWSIDREIEDLAAVIEAAGGRAHVYGISSGGVLAVEAANRGLPIDRLMVYEAPAIVDPSGPADHGFVAGIEVALAAGRPAAAVRHFLRGVGLPRPAIAVMSLLPMWKRMVALAPTLRYDVRITEPYGTGAPLPANPWPGATMPALVIGGGRSDAWMQSAQRAIADALANGTHRTLDGQNHMVKAKALAPVLADFLGAEAQVDREAAAA